ncbi:MAG: glutamate--tRNA ligase [Bdellovibrionales bacterium]|nr:glutamate--tRNA ligase [Bdellovibrionales bacterium]
MSNSVRVRFAPSPTGFLHVGGARTALYNYLFAKKHGGSYILRVEDTDEERSTEESMKMQIQDMTWLGLHWDEGVDPSTFGDKGDNGPYRQSQRRDTYKQYVDRLLESGKAFYCFMTEEQIDQKREQLKAAGLPLQLKSDYRDMSLEEAKAKLAEGEAAVVRFRIPDQNKEYTFNDLVRGEVTANSDAVGDFAIVRASGMPVYNFVCAVDDALMKITHVLRGEDHLNNTVKQIMILEALEMNLPEFGHLSTILGPDKSKLSKRHGATSCDQYRHMGVLPEALLNFIALLGWSHPEGEEVFSLKNLEENFSSDRLNASPAVFDETKLKWVNAMHLRKLSGEQLWAEIQPHLDQAGLSFDKSSEWKAKALELFKPYMELLSDSVNLFAPLDDSKFAIAEEATEALTWESSPVVLQTWLEILRSHGGETLSEEDFSEAQNKIKKDATVKGKFLFMPIRVGIIGKPHGAELKILVPLMEKSSLIERAEKALEKAKSLQS